MENCWSPKECKPAKGSRDKRMSKSTYAATFFLIWWVVLFAVLPWGVRSQLESGDTTPGTDPGAPVVPKLGRKLLWTTLRRGASVFGLLYRH
jgi:predicted secreted protein